MARGNEIIVTADPHGHFETVIIDGTPKPGTIMTVKPGVAVDANGHFEYEAAGASAGLMAADGDRVTIGVLLPDHLQGKTATDAYVDGDLGIVYFPITGEQLNILKLDVSGTGDDFTVGQHLIVDDGTGKVLGTTGTPESEPFIALEAVTDPTADQLVWCQYTGN